MSILFFILFGLIVGLLARAVMPGKQSMGLIATTLLGILGSILGGFVGNLVHQRPLLEAHSSGLVGSVLGALAILVIATYAGRRRGAYA